jgi:hypothetical protein
MLPRTVQMAKAVESQFTATQLSDYGNIILNGYATTGPNSTGKLAWQYRETLTPPVALPSVTSVRPALKGWTTNYMEYYTQLPPNGYGVNPGDPTMFNYSVHSFTPQTGAVIALGRLQSGQLYTPGTYTNVPTVGGSGTGATLNITVNADGNVTVVTLNAAGSGYAAGDGLGVASPGALGFGYGLAVAVAAVSNVSPAGQPRWAQAPHRFFQNQVADFVPPNVNQKAIQYSAILYPSSM